MVKKIKLELVIFIILLMFITFVYLENIKKSITGFATKEEAIINVSRLITKDKDANLTRIQISIISTKNVIAIKEILSENCSVLDSYVNPEIDLVAFRNNQTENIWILANYSENLITDLYYTISYDCDVIDGNYYFLSGENLSTFGLNTSQNLTQQTQQNEKEEDSGVSGGGGDGSGGGSSSSSGGGGGGGGGGSSTNSPSIPITTEYPSSQLLLNNGSILQTESPAQFEEFKSKAKEIIKKISGEEEGEIKKTSFLLFLILGFIIVVLVIVFLILFLRKPKINKELEENQSNYFGRAGL